jgi:hypothetical protein
MDDLQKVYQLLMPRLQASADLEKQASTEALTTKAATDAVTLGLLKSAAGALTKGLMYGAGAAIPVGLMGAGLIRQAGGESRKSIEDARNKALQTALGIAAIGGGLYALHRTLKPDTKTTTAYQRHPGTGELVPVKQLQSKVSAAQDHSEVLLEKLATVGFLDVLFENQRAHGEDKATRTKAAECLLLNAEHGADLLRQLLD